MFTLYTFLKSTNEQIIQKFGLRFSNNIHEGHFLYNEYIFTRRIIKPIYKYTKLK